MWGSYIYAPYRGALDRALYIYIYIATLYIYKALYIEPYNKDIPIHKCPVQRVWCMSPRFKLSEAQNLSLCTITKEGSCLECVLTTRERLRCVPSQLQGAVRCNARTWQCTCPSVTNYGLHTIQYWELVSIHIGNSWLSDIGNLRFSRIWKNRADPILGTREYPILGLRDCPILGIRGYPLVGTPEYPKTIIFLGSSNFPKWWFGEWVINM